MRRDLKIWYRSGRIVTGVLCGALVCTGCVRKDKAPMTLTEADRAGEEIPVDYPFTGDQEGYTLSLVPDGAAADAYAVQVCDEAGHRVQRFSCGQVREPEVFCDSLGWGGKEDLEIFSEAEKGPDQVGQLFLWDYEEKRFSETAIEIPWYRGGETGEEIVWAGKGFLVCQDTGDAEEKKICQIDPYTKRTVEVRRWIFDRTESCLIIRDCMEERDLFAGAVELDSEGGIQDELYYQAIFQEQIPVIGREGEISGIDTWVAGQTSGEDSEQSGFEYVQEQVFGNKGGTETYPGREELLKDFGFSDKEPFYIYYDQCGNLRLELYLDGEMRMGCGLRHTYWYTGDGKKIEQMYGFAFDSVREAAWMEPEILVKESVLGGTGADSVEDYEEETACREDGKPEHYVSRGIISCLKDAVEPGVPADILRVNYVYREDGTLYRREYWHNSFIFGSTSWSLRSSYDGSERLIYENGYITHGDYENYYIYTDEGRKPAYGLFLDNNLNYCIPILVKYE